MIARDMKLIIIIIILFFIPTCSDMTIHDDADWSFIAIGDIRSGYGTYERFLRIMDRICPSPKFMILHGDIIGTPGNDQEWNRFWRISKIITDKVPIYFLPGNHDVDDFYSEKIYKENVNMPGNGLYYSFQYNNFYFIILDTEIPGEIKGILSDQYTWLVNELDTAQPDVSVDHIVVSLHRPLYQDNGAQGLLVNNQQLITLLESYGKVGFVISGHVHAFYYHKINDILHMTTGGGGSPLHDKKGKYFHFTKVGIYNSGSRVNIKTIGFFGETIENFDM